MSAALKKILQYWAVYTIAPLIICVGVFLAFGAQHIAEQQGDAVTAAGTAVLSVLLVFFGAFVFVGGMWDLAKELCSNKTQ